MSFLKEERVFIPLFTVGEFCISSAGDPLPNRCICVKDKDGNNKIFPIDMVFKDINDANVYMDKVKGIHMNSFYPDFFDFYMSNDKADFIYSGNKRLNFVSDFYDLLSKYLKIYSSKERLYKDVIDVFFTFFAGQYKKQINKIK